MADAEFRECLPRTRLGSALFPVVQVVPRASGSLDRQEILRDCWPHRVAPSSRIGQGCRAGARRGKTPRFWPPPQVALRAVQFKASLGAGASQDPSSRIPSATVAATVRSAYWGRLMAFAVAWSRCENRRHAAANSWNDWEKLEKEWRGRRGSNPRPPT